MHNYHGKIMDCTKVSKKKKKLEHADCKAPNMQTWYITRFQSSLKHMCFIFNSEVFGPITLIRKKFGMFHSSSPEEFISFICSFGKYFQLPSCLFESRKVFCFHSSYKSCQNNTNFCSPCFNSVQIFVESCSYMGKSLINPSG